MSSNQKKLLSMNTMNEKTFKYLCFSSALCMFFSMIEYAIPKPLPFLRLGLANIPFILGLFKLKKKEYFFLVFLKVIFQSLISGTFFSYIFLYSLLGSFAAGFFMLLSKSLFKDKISVVGISLFGALGNNLVQIVLSYFFFFGKSIIYAVPLILIFGFITGTLIGIISQRFIKISNWFSKVEAYWW